MEQFPDTFMAYALQEASEGKDIERTKELRKRVRKAKQAGPEMDKAAQLEEIRKVLLDEKDPEREQAQDQAGYHDKDDGGEDSSEELLQTFRALADGTKNSGRSWSELICCRRSTNKVVDNQTGRSKAQKDDEDKKKTEDSELRAYREEF